MLKSRAFVLVTVLLLQMVMSLFLTLGYHVVAESVRQFQVFKVSMQKVSMQKKKEAVARLE